MCFGRHYLTLLLVQAGFICVVLGISSKSNQQQLLPLLFFLLLLLAQVQLDLLSAGIFQPLLQSQPIMLTLLVINIREHISEVGPQAKYQRIPHASVAQPQGHRIWSQRQRRMNQCGCPWLGLRWHSSHCLALPSFLLTSWVWPSKNNVCS